MLKKVANFHFQKQLNLIVSNSLFGCNNFCSCNSISYKNSVFENIAEVEVVGRITNYAAFYYDRATNK